MLFYFHWLLQRGRCLTPKISPHAIFWHHENSTKFFSVRFNVSPGWHTMTMHWQMAKFMRRMHPAMLSALHCVQEHEWLIALPERKHIDPSALLSQ